MVWLPSVAHLDRLAQAEQSGVISVKLVDSQMTYTVNSSIWALLRSDLSAWDGEEKGEKSDA